MTFTIGHVLRVEERFQTVALRGAGDKAETEKRSTGWWIVLDTGFAFGLGANELDYQVGDEIRAVRVAR